MAKPSKLKKENGYWIACIGGKKRSFGNATKVSMIEARKLFGEALANGPELTVVKSKTRSGQPTVDQMIDDYLDWMQAEADFSTRHIANNRSIFKCFLTFKLPRTKREVQGMKAIDITANDLKEFLKAQKARLSDKSYWHYYTALSACWNWAAGRKGHAASHLPETHRPFNELATPAPPKKELLATDLLTDSELKLIMERSKEFGADELFTVMYQTGCRPGELENCLVRDFDEVGSQLVLYKHKNGKRQASVKPRRIGLPKKSFAIVQRRARERKAYPDAPLFVGPDLTGLVNTLRKPELSDEMIARVKEELALNTSAKEVAEFLGLKRQVVQRIKRGKPFPSEQKKADERKRERGYVRSNIPWTTDRLNAVLRGIRANDIRESMTAYCFRDLYISEMLRNGTPIFEVARLTGTSAKMIDEHYGHFFMDASLAKSEQLEDIRTARQEASSDTPVQPVARRRPRVAKARTSAADTLAV
jgi:integrase